MEELDIVITDEEIQSVTKVKWKKYIHEEVESLALKSLIEENSQKSKTKHIQFDQLSMSKYLENNENTLLSQIIFSVRSGTMDIKSWNEWNYQNILCVMCEKSEENINHFMTCTLYGEEIETPLEEIFGNEVDKQCLIAIEIKRRQQMRNSKLEEVGLPDNLAPMLQASVEQQ